MSGNFCRHFCPCARHILSFTHSITLKHMWSDCVLGICWMIAFCRSSASLRTHSELLDVCSLYWRIAEVRWRWQLQVSTHWWVANLCQFNLATGWVKSLTKSFQKCLWNKLSASSEVDVTDLVIRHIPRTAFFRGASPFLVLGEKCIATYTPVFQLWKHSSQNLDTYWVFFTSAWCSKSQPGHELANQTVHLLWEDKSIAVLLWGQQMLRR